MNILQKALYKSLAELPRISLERVIAQKLQDQSIKVPKSVPAELAKSILSGNMDTFRFGKGSANRDVTLSITQEDIDKISRSITDFQAKLPQFIPDFASQFAKKVLKDLQAKWPEEYLLQNAEIVAFRERLEERWGEPLHGLRMLLTIARDWGREAHDRKSLRKVRNKVQKHILLRLHVRACQVTDEIICLLENGFADGAMARWRTLHELAVIADVISQHGEGIAERYLEHQAIESKRAMKKYINSSALLGYRPLPDREVAKIEKAYQRVITKYGKDFDSDFGWANYHLKKRRVTFADLEAAAGRADMRSYYQMGNDNVHAGVKSLFVRLGLMDDVEGLLAGRSNAGLIEPGQNAALTLTRISILVCLADATFDNIVASELMRQHRDTIPMAFARADRRLRKDDKEFKRARQAKRHLQKGHRKKP